LSGCAHERAQQAADLDAGAQALSDSVKKATGGTLPTDVAAILDGIHKRLPAVAEVNHTEWPQPTMTAVAIAANPMLFNTSAPPEPAPSTPWLGYLVAGGAGLAWLVGRLAPSLPGAGPVIGGIADLAWGALAHKDQKNADAAKDIIQSAAERAAPLLQAFTAIPVNQLPPALRPFANPIILNAIDTLASTNPNIPNIPMPTWQDPPSVVPPRNQATVPQLTQPVVGV